MSRPFDIGVGKQVFICAEIGQNHNGSLDLALQLVEAAKRAGADAVKFQKRDSDMSVPEAMKGKMRETPWGTISYLDYRKRLELGPSDYLEISRFCRQVGIPWFASAWDMPSVEFLREFDLPAWKVASAMATNDRLLLEMRKDGRQIILSTGMTTMQEIHWAVHLVSHGEGSPLVICHCNSTYPCPVEDLNLRVIQTLMAEFPGVPVGYSGHEVGLATTLAAVALGAVYVERHLTLDRSMWGTDHAASVEPGGFARLVKDIRNIERAMGDGVKRVTPGELEVMARLRGVPAVQ